MAAGDLARDFFGTTENTGNFTEGSKNAGEVARDHTVTLVTLITPAFRASLIITLNCQQYDESSR